MKHSTADIAFQATDFFQDQSSHALLVSAFNFAKSTGFFSKMDHCIKLKMKRRRYSWSDKLRTLWASIVVGCDHTSEINSRLGSHERAAAALMGLDRFPDQSQVNRLLWAFETDHINQWRHLHLDLLCRYSRARCRKHWMRLANKQRMLAADIDQRALVTSSNHFEFSTKGYFGRKRGRFGYQLSMAFVGGEVGEVVDEYLDSGNTAMGHRIDDLLESLEQFCKRTNIARDSILIRGDAQLGTVPIILKIKARGFHFLFKGISSRKARKLLKQVNQQAIFWQVENGANRDAAWMCDMGEVEHKHVRRRQTGEAVEARTLLMVRRLNKHRSKRAAPEKREELTEQGKQTEKETKVDYFLTDLSDKQLPVEAVLESYHSRSTIERYFYDEQYGLGARQVRTHHYAGEAMFEFLVATTNNLLRWMKHSTFRGTEIEKMGLKRIVREAMQIPGRIKKKGKRWVVEMPREHPLVKLLLRSWSELSLEAESP